MANAATPAAPAAAPAPVEAPSPKAAPMSAQTDQAISPVTPDASSATPTPTKEGGGGYTELISPKAGFRVYRVPNEKVQAFKDYGYVESKGNALNEKQVQSNFDYWRDAGTDFVISTVGDAPFVRTAVGKLGTKEQAKWLADDLDAYHKEHPLLSVGSGVLGTGLEMVGAAAVAAPALAAAGITGAAGAAGAGAAGLLGMGTGAAAETIGGAMAAGAVTNATLGAISRMDDAALHHAFEPAGQEKIAWSLTDQAKNILTDAALGAAIPGLGGVAAKSLGWLGKNMGSQAQKALRATLLKEREVVAATKQGRGADLVSKIDEVMTNAPKTAPGYVKAQRLKFGVEMENIKRVVGKRTSLSDVDRKDLIQQIYHIAGADDQIITRLQKFFSQPEFTLDHLQKMNLKTKESIGWTDYDVNRAVNDKYQQVMEATKGGMQKILQDHDASFGGTTSSEWNSAMKHWSDWTLLDTALNKRANAETIGSVFRNVASNAAGGFVLGTAVSGGDIHKGLTGAMFGAGMGVVKNVKPATYALAVQKLGGLFEHFDKKLTSATMSGLYGLPAQLHARHFDDPAQLNAALSAVSSDPQKAYTNIHSHYVNSGVPDVQANDAANRHFSMLTDIAQLQPKRSAGADLPTKSLGDPMQQRKIQGLAAVAHDPTYALANPTKDNIAFLAKHFPQILFSAQQACVQQLQQNPDLPYAAKQYCSRIMQRPVSNSTSPNFSQMIQQARQKVAQGEQQAAQGGSQPPKQVSSSDSPGANTRFDGLQGGN